MQGIGFTTVTFVIEQLKWTIFSSPVVASCIMLTKPCAWQLIRTTGIRLMVLDTQKNIYKIHNRFSLATYGGSERSRTSDLHNVNVTL